MISAWLWAIVWMALAVMILSWQRKAILRNSSQLKLRAPLVNPPVFPSSHLQQHSTPQNRILPNGTHLKTIRLNRSALSVPQPNDSQLPLHFSAKKQSGWPAKVDKRLHSPVWCISLICLC